MSNSTSILGSNATVLYSQNYSNNSNIPDSEYIYENKIDTDYYNFNENVADMFNDIAGSSIVIMTCEGVQN